MARKKVVLFLFLLNTVSILAQGGISLGLNLSKKTYTDGTNLAGFYIGFLRDIKLSNRFYLQPNLIFTLGGTKLSYGEEDISYYSNYLELPLFASFRIPTNNDDNFSVNIAPYVAYKIYESARYSDNSIPKGIFSRDPIYDYGIMWGVGYSNKGNSQYFFINLKHGLRNIRHPYDISDVGHNFSFRIGLAWIVDFSWM